jgi:uncharacterized CHY-type Zn-finger protein
MLTVNCEKAEVINKRVLCPECQTELDTINYKIWGTKRFNTLTGSYEEQETLGSYDMNFSCPNCETLLDSEAVLA